VLALGARDLGDLTAEELLAEDVVLAVELPLRKKLDPVGELLDDPGVPALVVGPVAAGVSTAAAALTTVALLVVLPAGDEFRTQLGEQLKGVVDELGRFSGGGEVGNDAPADEGALGF